MNRGICLIDKIKNAVEDMYEDEAKDLLQSILIQLNLLEENYSEDTIKNLMDIPKQLTSNPTYKRNVKKYARTYCFDDSTAGCVKYMLSQEELFEESVVAFRNSFQLNI